MTLHSACRDGGGSLSRSLLKPSLECRADKRGEIRHNLDTEPNRTAHQHPLISPPDSSGGNPEIAKKVHLSFGLKRIYIIPTFEMLMLRAIRFSQTLPT